MKKKIFALFIVLTMCMAVFAGCGSSGSESTADSSKGEGAIMFCGSTSLYPIMSSLASSFTDEYETWNNVDAALPETNISIYVAPGGSGVGVSAVEEGTADFGMVAREVKDEEKEALGDGYQVIEGATTNTITINSLDKVYHYSVNVTDCYGNQVSVIGIKRRGAGPSTGQIALSIA